MQIDLENKLKELQKKKTELEKEIEDLADKICFNYQSEKTDIAKERLNKWYKKDSWYIKIYSITGNTYKYISLSISLGFISDDFIVSEDYYPNEYVKCSNEEVKEIEQFFIKLGKNT